MLGFKQIINWCPASAPCNCPFFMLSAVFYMDHVRPLLCASKAWHLLSFLPWWTPVWNPWSTKKSECVGKSFVISYQNHHVQWRWKHTRAWGHETCDLLSADLLAHREGDVQSYSEGTFKCFAQPARFSAPAIRLKNMISESQLGSIQQSPALHTNGRCSLHPAQSRRAWISSLPCGWSVTCVK